MPCHLCHSGNVREYPAEINIHVPGMKGLDIPTVLVFPTILVCLGCGATQFTLPETERRELQNRDYRDLTGGTAVL